MDPNQTLASKPELTGLPDRPRTAVLRGCPSDLGEHACMYQIGTHEGLHECECGEQWETEDLG